MLLWQLAATMALTLIAGFWLGLHGAFSAVLGGAVSVCAGMASAYVATKGSAQSAGGILVGALRAEAVKIGLIVALLLLVMAAYDEVVAGVFFASFIATVLIFSMAFFVRENE